MSAKWSTATAESVEASRGLAGLTSGQLWTVGIAGGIGATLLLVSVPAVHRADSLASAKSPPVGGSAPTPGPASPSAGPPTPAPSQSPGQAGAPAPAQPPVVAPGTSGPVGPSESGGSPQPTPSGTTSPPAGEPAIPLTVLASGWSSQASGTPVATAGVPTGGLPVGARGGQAYEASYVRLAGTDTTLQLAVSSANGASVSGTAVGVLACQITTPDWKPEQAGSPSAAPKVDPRHCVQGKALGDGSWVFDLKSFAHRTDDRGIALMPDLSTTQASAPATFRVTFMTSRTT